MNGFGIGSLSCYDSLDQVGEGTYGYVYKGKDIRNNESVALKRLIFHRESAGFPLCAVREIKFLKSLQHKNIVLLKDVVTSKGCDHLELPIKTDSVKEDDTSASKQSDVGQIGEQKKLRNEYQDRENSFKDVMKICGNLYLVFEFVDHDIGGLIDAKYKFPVRAIKSIMKQLFEVLDFLNDKKIIHRDIKSSNILISSRHQVKLADFGLARSTLSSDGRESRVDMTNNVITMWYKPPELLLGAVRYGSAVDMWSAGCVLAELELGRPLFPGKAELEQLDLICRALGTPGEDVWPGVSGMANFSDLLKNLPKYAASLKISYGSKLSEPALNLLERILVVDPARRSSAKIALTNKYFLTSPLPPIDPADLEPLNVTSGVSYHEYKTKQVRKQREQEEAKKLSDAADAAALQLLPPPPQPPIPSSQLTASSHNAPNPFTMTAPQHPAAPYLPRPPVQMVATNPYPQTGLYAPTGGYGQPAAMGYPRGAVLSSSGIQYGRGGPAHSVPMPHMQQQQYPSSSYQGGGGGFNSGYNQMPPQHHQQPYQHQQFQMQNQHHPQQQQGWVPPPFGGAQFAPHSGRPPPPRPVGSSFPVPVSYSSAAPPSHPSAAAPPTVGTKRPFDNRGYEQR